MRVRVPSGIPLLSVMKKKIEYTTSTIAIFCDKCGREAVPYTRRVKKCQICSKDVCSECSIITDDDYLADGAFMGDYPNHYCDDCWEKGKDIIEAIFACRNAAEKEESELWKKWRRG